MIQVSTRTGTSSSPRPHKAITSVALRSPGDGELRAILVDFVPAHAHYGEAAFLNALRERLESHGLALTYRARMLAVEERRRCREPIAAVSTSERLDRVAARGGLTGAMQGWPASRSLSEWLIAVSAVLRRSHGTL